MAETVADHVVNGNQSMGCDPAPVDTPQETQPSSRTAGEVGDDGTQNATSNDTKTQDQTHASTVPQSADHQAVAPSDVGLEQSTIPQQDQPNHEQISTVNPGADLANGNPDTTAFPEPSPMSPHGGELEWRRPSFTAPGTSGRGERSNSYKKPTSFKSVSVTKNFLAKSSNGTAPTTKVGPDKLISPSPTPSSNALGAKPRLVAKSVRDARSPALAGPGSPAGPDASKVWNRNRPVPLPPPKQFTDEELKQQYGIHLATRLQSDEPGKGSKWADMEDDEDDWAPDTVEWMDGTKTTLQPENQQPPIQDSRQLPPKPSTEEAIDDSEPPKTSPGIGPGKTILRPGARASQTITKPGLVLRSVPENQAPPPQPTPNGSSKSPWAPLPPVDKVSPVTFVPPPSQTPSHLRRDSSAAAPSRDYNLPTTSPAREMAADTFDRSWRNYEGGSRELFDAKSGRYEPAKGTRRSSFRQEGNFRPPSLLQRPSQYDQDRSYGSQDARNFERKQSPMSTDSHVASDRKSSFVDDAQTSERTTSPQVARSDTSPNQTALPIPSHSDSKDSHRVYAAHASDGQASSPNVDGASSDVQLQQQLMRQRIEANRRRKQEEQAREEAAKQERIRQKLQALDIASPVTAKPDELQGAGKTLEANGASQPSITPATGHVLSPANNKPIGSGKGASSAIVPATSPTKSDEQPHLDGLGEIPVNASSIGPTSQPLSYSAINQTSSLAPHRQLSQFSSPGTKLSSSPRLASENFPHHPSQPSLHPSQSSSHQYFALPSDPTHPPSADNRPFPPNHSPSPASFERSRHHWASSQPSHPRSGWSSNAGPPHTFAQANVWGPPTSDKALGNGAFEPDLHRPPYQYPPPQFRQSPQPPGPIAPPSISPIPQAPPRTDSQVPNTTSMSSTMMVQSPTEDSFKIGPTPAAATGPKKSSGMPNGIKFDTTGYGKNAAKARRPLSPPRREAADAWNHTDIVRSEAARRATLKAQREAAQDNPVDPFKRDMESTFGRDNEPIVIKHPSIGTDTNTRKHEEKPLIKMPPTEMSSAEVPSTKMSSTKMPSIKMPSIDMPADATQDLFGTSMTAYVIKPGFKHTPKTIFRMSNNESAVVNLPPPPMSAPTVFSRPPGHNGAQSLIAQLGTRGKVEDLLGFFRESSRASVASTLKPLPPTIATKPTFDASDASNMNKVEVVLPGLTPIAGFKTGNVPDTKDGDNAVFPDPENGSRPAVNLSDNVPMISKDVTESALAQKRAASPGAQTVSSLSSEQEDFRKRAEITVSIGDKYRKLAMDSKSTTQQPAARKNGASKTSWAKVPKGPSRNKKY